MERSDTTSMSGGGLGNQQQPSTFTQSDYQMFHAAFTSHHQQHSQAPHPSPYSMMMPPYPHHPNNNNGASHNPNYSWQGVMEFLRDQELKAMDREQKLINDKKSLEDRVKSLEDELSKQVQVNKDLVKKMRVIEYQMLQPKRRVKHGNPLQNSTSGMGTIGTGSGSGTAGSGTIGPIQINPALIKRPRHQRGNSDGIYNIASRLFTSHHTRGSSGSNGQNKTFEENIDNGVALLSQTLELVQEAAATNSRTLAHNFNYPSHQKTNSSDTQETIESQQFTKFHKQIDNASSKQFLLPTSVNHTIPQKRRQISNGSQLSQQLTMTHDPQQPTQKINSTAQLIPQQSNPSNQKVTITTTTTITQSSAPKSGEVGQRRKWLVQESVVAQDQTIVEQPSRINDSMNTTTLSQRCSNSQQSRTKAQQLSQVITQQEKFNKVERTSVNALNTSANSAISGGKKTHQVRKILFQQKCFLKSHLDSVRGLQFVNGTNSLVSASEDCTLKVWDVNKFCTLKDAEGQMNIEPYVTLRGHLSPIVALSASQGTQNPYIQNLVISGSRTGSIRAWKIPAMHQVNPYGANQDQSYCVANWENAHNNEPIWDLKIHPFENIFLSVGSDYTVGMWQIPTPNSSSFIEGNSLESAQSTLLGRFRKTHFISHSNVLMPTSCSWLQSDSNTFLVSYVDPLMSFYDASTGKEKGIVPFQYDESKPYNLQQINKVVVSESQKLIIAGTEDNLIRLFDLNSHKLVKTIVAHTDAVTSLLIQNKSSHQIFISGSHDGAVRAWDLRTFQCVYDNPVHRKKYDEGVLTLASSDKYPLIASGGADSLIKIIHEQ